MFDYFRGLITDKKRTSKGTFITIEASSVGYLLEVTEHDFMQLSIDENNSQKVYVLLTHREDAMSLYGFSNKETRDIFQILLSVSGVGAKMAIALLNEFDACDLISLVIDGNFKDAKPKVYDYINAHNITKDMVDFYIRDFPVSVFKNYYELNIEDCFLRDRKR